LKIQHIIPNVPKNHIPANTMLHVTYMLVVISHSTM